MIDKEEWRKQCRFSLQQQQPPATNATQPPVQPAKNTRPHQQAFQTTLEDALDPTSYVGPNLDSIDHFASSNYTQTSWHNLGLVGKLNFQSKYARSVQQGKHEMQIKEEGGVGPGNEPGKWLVDTGASNHYSSFKYLFLHLTSCIPPVEILTGNGWVSASYYGTIPLFVRVEREVLQVHIKQVLYMPTLQTRVNLFSMVVLADRGYFSNFGPHNIKFLLDGQFLAQGIKLGSSWYLDCDIRSHELCLTTQDNGYARPDTLEV